MIKEIEVIFTDGLSGSIGKVVLLSDGKSAVVVEDAPYSTYISCISAGNASMLEEAAKALGAERLLWEAFWESQWSRFFAHRWPQSIKHELVIPNHQCKTQDEFLRLCDEIAARLP